MGSLTVISLIVVSFTLFCGLSAGPGDSETWYLIPSNNALVDDAIRAALFASSQITDVAFDRVNHPTQGAVYQFQLARFRWYRVWFIVRNMLNGQRSRCRAWVNWDLVDIKQLVEANPNWTSRCWPLPIPGQWITANIGAPRRSAIHRRKPVLGNAVPRKIASHRRKPVLSNAAPRRIAAFPRRKPVLSNAALRRRTAFPMRKPVLSNAAPRRIASHRSKPVLSNAAPRRSAAFPRSKPVLSNAAPRRRAAFPRRKPVLANLKKVRR